MRLFGSILAGIREKAPLVHHITNYVTVNDCANITLSVGALPVMAHAVQNCQSLGWDVTHACCIYPCAPLLSGQDMAQALALALESNANFVYPVTEFAHPIQRAMRRLPNGQMQFLQPEHEMARTQDLEKTYHDAGQFYWGRAAAWLAHKRMHSAGLGFPIPHWRVVDIDTEDDWKRAELIYRALATRP